MMDRERLKSLLSHYQSTAHILIAYQKMLSPCARSQQGSVDRL